MDLAVETAKPLPGEMTEAQQVDEKLVGMVPLHGILLSKMMHVDSTANQR